MLRLGPAFVLYALMDAVVDRYFPVLDMLETELEKIEELIFSQGRQRDNIQRLYELKRKVTIVRHVVSPLMEAVGRLHGGRVPSMCQETQEYFRDVHDHLHRISASLDGIRDTIATAIQVNLSMVAIEESEVNKRLAALVSSAPPWQFTHLPLPRNRFMPWTCCAFMAVESPCR